MKRKGIIGKKMKTYTVSWLENLNVNETLAPLFMNRVSIIKSEDDICEGCEIAYPIYNPAWASCYKMHRNVKLHVLETSNWNRGAKIWKAQNEDENTIILVL